MAEADPSVFASLPLVQEREASDAASLDDLLKDADAPFVVRGLVREWPLVQAGLQSPKAARDYLLERARSVNFTVSVGEPGHDGRMFYTDGMEMNFRTARGKLADIFRGFDDNEGRADPPTVYLGSVDLNQFFEGVTQENAHPLGERTPRESIWIGTPTRIAAHNDFPDNLACCAVGKRRFTILPPEQFRNLYIGPIDNTPAGRAISMVDFHAPDLARYPRFEEALHHAQVAELEPGDAVFIPSMWWHHVEGLSPFNILVNYWWRETPSYLGDPHAVLNHAILSIRDLPEKDKQIWRDMFDYYVFEGGDAVSEHLPDGGRGILDPIDKQAASRIKAFLLRALN